MYNKDEFSIGRYMAICLSVYIAFLVVTSIIGWLITPYLIKFFDLPT